MHELPLLDACSNQGRQMPRLSQLVHMPSSLMQAENREK
jgi:hypothetical protein